MTVNGRGVGDLIYLYTEKQDSDEWILKNDLYFNLYTGNQPLTVGMKIAVFWSILIKSNVAWRK